MTIQQHFFMKNSHKIELSSQRKEVLLFFSSSMAALTSRANQQQQGDCMRRLAETFLGPFFWVIGLEGKLPATFSIDKKCRTVRKFQASSETNLSSKVQPLTLQSGTHNQYYRNSPYADFSTADISLDSVATKLHTVRTCLLNVW